MTSNLEIGWVERLERVEAVKEFKVEVRSHEFIIEIGFVRLSFMVYSRRMF